MQPLAAPAAGAAAGPQQWAALAGAQTQALEMLAGAPRVLWGSWLDLCGCVVGLGLLCRCRSRMHAACGGHPGGGSAGMRPVESVNPPSPAAGREEHSTKPSKKF